MDVYLSWKYNFEKERKKATQGAQNGRIKNKK